MEANYGLQDVKEESQYRWPSQKLNPKPNLHTFPKKTTPSFPLSIELMMIITRKRFNPFSD